MTQVKINRKPFDGSFNNLIDDLFADLPVLNRNEQLDWISSGKH